MYNFKNFTTRRSIRNKITNYLFNPQNREGWAKGQWFVQALDFDPLQPRHILMLERQVVFEPLHAVFSRKSKWGDRFNQELSITGPNGKTIKGVRAKWQKSETSGIITLMTLLPPKYKKAKPNV